MQKTKKEKKLNQLPAEEAAELTDEKRDSVAGGCKEPEDFRKPIPDETIKRDEARTARLKK